MNESLRQQVAELPEDTRNKLKEHGFDVERFLGLARRLTGEVSHSNFVTGTLTAPTDDDIAAMPELDTAESERLEQLGLAALKDGQCAMVVLAGGMATRMG